MILRQDTDQAWVEEDFGSDKEEYLLKRITQETINEILLKRQPRFPWWNKFMLWFSPIHVLRLNQKIEEEVYAQIILDWKGVFVSSCEPAECNKANILILIETSKKRKDWIMAKALLPSTFDDKVEELLKKSLGLSLTTSNGEISKDNGQTVPLV